MDKKVELLAPAGDMEKLKTALHFGADAVYFAGKRLLGIGKQLYKKAVQ